MRIDTSKIDSIFPEMIRIPTVSGIGNEKLYEIGRYRKYLSEQFKSLFEVAEINQIDEALLICLKGKDPNLLPVLFTGHMDVVPISNESAWRYPPFSGTIIDGSVWGRGTQDMKSAQCALLYAWNYFFENKMRQNRDVYIYLSCDEETGGRTTKKAATFLQKKGIRFQAVFDEGGIITDSYMGLDRRIALLGIAEKGSLEFEFVARAEGGHASNPPSNSAIVRMAKMVTDLENHPVFRQELSSESKTSILAAMEYMEEDRKEEFRNAIIEPSPYLCLHKILPDANTYLGTTIAFTMINGGVAFNSLPTEVSLVANVRVGSIQRAKEVKEVLSKKASEYNIKCNLVSGEDFSKVTSVESWSYKVIEKCIGSCFKNVSVLPFVLNGGTDSRHFQMLTNEVIRFSPIFATNDQGKGVHGNNEYCNIDAVKKGAEFYFYLFSNFI